MKFSIYTIGKLKEPYLREGVQEFLKRLKPYGQVAIVELNEEKMGDKPSEAERKTAVQAEGVRLLKQIKERDYLILLDVYGKTMSSEALSALFDACALRGQSDIAFVIGGAFGVSEELREKADLRLSFSPMTFTHQMVRLLLVEQIYRALKISRKEPYHW